MSEFKSCIVLSLQYEPGLNYGYNLDTVKNVIDSIYKYNIHIPPIILLTNYKDLTITDKRINEIHQINTELYKPLGKENPYGTIGFYKLDVFSIYDYDRIIYLDLDILVRQNISELWNPTKFAQFEIYAFNEKDISLLDNQDNYYNFGVMIINRSPMFLNEHMYKLLIKLVNNIFPTRYEAEKDILKFTITNYHVPVGNLPQQYNHFAPLIKTEQDFKQSKIIHFNTFPKPWRTKNPNSNMKKLYYRVLTEI